MKDIHKKSKREVEAEFYGSNEEFIPPKQNLACVTFLLFVLILFLAGIYLLWKTVPYVAHVQNRADELRANLNKPKEHFWESWFKKAKDSSKDITNNIKDSTQKSINSEINQATNSLKDSVRNSAQNEISNQTNQVTDDLINSNQ